MRATCAFYLVLHDKDLITADDYGFVKVAGGQSFEQIFVVGHKRRGVDVELPIHGGLYKPEAMKGAAEAMVRLVF